MPRERANASPERLQRRYGERDDGYERRLLWHAFFLFLLGLGVGLAVAAQLLRSPRLGLSAHLIALIDVGVLATLSLAWKRMVLPDNLKRMLFRAALYGLYTGWASNVLGAIFGTSQMTPIAGGGLTAAAWQNHVVAVGLVSSALALLLTALLALWGLRAAAARKDHSAEDLA